MPRQIVHRGRKISVALDTTILADGSTLRRDMIFHPGAVVILPMVSPASVCLLRNHRFVIDTTLWEIPAGTLEPGEAIELAARRELAEETGYTAARWTYLGFFYASPGVLDEKLHLFVAEELTPGPTELEPGETIEPIVVEWAEAMRMCLAGEILDAKTITALLLWDRKRTNPGGDRV